MKKLTLDDVYYASQAMKPGTSVTYTLAEEPGIGAWIGFLVRLFLSQKKLSATKSGAKIKVTREA